MAAKHKSVTALVPTERIERRILLIRGEKVMLDSDLAELYDVETRVLIQAVKRNMARFPADFMFQLSAEENAFLRSQFVISNAPGRGGRRYRPYAFTEHGVAMLSSVLNSPRAIEVNIEIMRALSRLRRILTSHAELARKIRRLERKQDARFKIVFDAIRALMEPPEPQQKSRIGYLSEGK